MWGHGLQIQTIIIQPANGVISKYLITSTKSVGVLITIQVKSTNCNICGFMLAAYFYKQGT